MRGLSPSSIPSFSVVSMSSSTSKIRAHSVKVLAWRRLSRVKNTTKVTASPALRHTSSSFNAIKSTDVWCGCSKCCVPRTALSALVGAPREVVYSYYADRNFVDFQRHTPARQVESLKYDCPRLHRIWVPNTMEPRGKKKIGLEMIVFGQILPHKIGVSDFRSPNSQIQLRYTPNTMPIKDGLKLLQRFEISSINTDHFSFFHQTTPFFNGTTIHMDIFQR